MSWVTNTTVELVRFQTVRRKSCIDTASLRVEGAERLVEQQDVGFGRQGPGDRDPLAHAARELVGRVVRELRQADDAEQLLHPSGALGLAHAHALEPERDVLRDRAPRIEAVGLEHHAAVGAGPMTGSWSISTVPDVGMSSPAMMFSSVDFPQPEDPTRHTNSRSATSRFTWSIASTVWRFVRNSFTRSVTTSFGAFPWATGTLATNSASSAPVDAPTVTTGPTATPGCATSGATGH